MYRIYIHTKILRVSVRQKSYRKLPLVLVSFGFVSNFRASTICWVRKSDRILLTSWTVLHSGHSILEPCFSGSTQPAQNEWSHGNFCGSTKTSMQTEHSVRSRIFVGSTPTAAMLCLLVCWLRVPMGMTSLQCTKNNLQTDLVHVCHWFKDFTCALLLSTRC